MKTSPPRTRAPAWVLGACLLTCCLAAGAACRRSHPDAGTLRIVGRLSIASPDPLGEYNYFALRALANVFDTLATFDESLALRPALAVSWTTPSERLWRFELRRGVRLHDGRILTSKDVKATLDRVIAGPDSWAAARIPLVSAVRTVGEWTVEIETREPDPLLMNSLTSLPILAAGPAPAPDARPAGTGPYRIARLTGDSLELEGFEAHWRGRPRWRRVVFSWDLHAPARIERLASGEADLVEAPPAERLEEIEAHPRLRVLEASTLLAAILAFDVEGRPGNPLASLPARRAVSLALDREGLVRAGFGGRGRPLLLPAPPEVFGVGREALGGPADPDRARESLREAGFPDGFAFTLDFTERDRRAAEAVAAQLAEVGVDVALRESNARQFGSRLEAGDASAYIFWLTFPRLDAADVLEQVFHSVSGRKGGSNFSGFGDPDLDARIDRAGVEISPTRRLDLLRDALRRAGETYSVLGLCAPRELYAARREIEWSGHPAGLILAEAITRSGR